MMADEFDWIIKAFTRRHPFEPFMIEFMNGQTVEIRHREAVAYWRNIAMYRDPIGRFQCFTAESVCRVLDKSNDEIEL